MTKSAVIIIFFALALNSLYSQDNDAVYNHIKYEYYLEKNGSWSMNYSQQMELYSYFAINRAYGESFIIYNPKYQELKVTKNQTKMRDGSIVVAPLNTYNEVLPKFAAGFPDALHLREMVVTHVGLERNCVVDLEYTIRSQPEFLPSMMDKIVIGKRSPVKIFEIIIKVPERTEFSINLANTYAPLNKKTENGFDIYTWTFENLDAIAPEYNQPYFEDFVPTLYFSTAKNDNDVIEHIMSDDKLFEVNNDIQKTVAKITNNKFSVFERSIAIRDYVFDNFNIMQNGLIRMGFKPKNAFKTFADGYGTQLDVCILIAAMAKHNGINATPVMISYSSSCSDDISILTQYQYPVVLIKDDDAFTPYMILDPTNKKISQLDNTYLGKSFLPIDSNFDDLVHLIPQRRTALLKNYVSLVVDDEFKISGINTVHIRGDYLSDYDKTSTLKKIIKNFEQCGFESQVQEDKAIVEQPGTYNQTFTLTGKIKESNIKEINNKETYNEFVTIELPQSLVNFASNNFIYPDYNRKTPVQLPYFPKEEETYIIEIPDNFKPLLQLIHIIASNEIGNVGFRISLTGNKIKIYRKLYILKQFIPPEEYKSLLELMTVYNKDIKTLTFEIIK